MNIIVAVDKNWAIGFQNKLLNSIPEDMKFFRETTTGHVVVMGRKTLESFPKGRPLKNRTNVVITRQKDYEVPGAVVVHSVQEALEYLKDFKSEDIYVIGGASIYEQMLPYCDVAHVTVMDYAYQADTWFRIWIRWKTLLWRRTARKKLISIWNIVLKCMFESQN